MQATKEAIPQLRGVHLNSSVHTNPTGRTIRLAPWQEVVGKLVRIERGNPNNLVSLIISTNEGLFQLNYLVNSKEGQMVMDSLSERDEGNKVGIVQTDSNLNPLLIRIF